MCSPDRPFQPYGSETRGQKTQGSERRYNEIPKISRADILQDLGKKYGCPSRKYILPDILELFQVRRESDILAHCCCRRRSRIMKPTVYALLQLMTTLIRSRLSLQLEIVALRHQLAVYQRTTKRPQIGYGDRILWSWLARRWTGWRDALVFVQTGTVIAWQRKRFREH